MESDAWEIGAHGNGTIHDIYTPLPLIVSINNSNYNDNTKTKRKIGTATSSCTYQPDTPYLNNFKDLTV